MDAQSYLEAIKLKLASSLIVKSVAIVQERASWDHGFFRARLILDHEEFVEVTEYFVVAKGRVETVEYRYQWVDATQQHLRRRWDNAEHYPDLPHFPHHIHLAEENEVRPGRLLSTIEVIDLIARELKAMFGDNE
jgi:hypothetical protein